MARKPNGHAPKQSTINLRVLSALSLYTASPKDENRYYLHGVCVEIDARSVTYVGTDGHRLLAYRVDLEPDEEDHTLTGTFIIPAAHCKSFKLGKDDDGRAIMSEDRDRLTIAHNFTDVTFLPIDGVYPHWRRVIPQRLPSGVPAQFNPKIIADLGKVAKLLDVGTPFVAHNGPEAPSIVWFSGHPNVMGIIMPFKTVDEMGREAPQWVRKGPQRDQGDVEDGLFTAEEDEEHDPETGELPPKPSKDERIAAVAVKAFGEPVELTEEEKAKGLTHAFQKEGSRIAMNFPEGHRVAGALTRIIAEKYGRNAETLYATSAEGAGPPNENEGGPPSKAEQICEASQATTEQPPAEA